MRAQMQSAPRCTAPLRPCEIARRHQALMNDYWNSRRRVACVDAGLAAGANSAPVGSKNSVEGPTNSPPVEAPAVIFSAGVRAVAEYAAVQAWAIAQGLCRRGLTVDLYEVNERRKALGLPPFALKASGGRA